jgi:LPLT family lysophospholipid transporter-like MFS transporter
VWAPAIAVQNLAENAAMLIMIGLYTVAARAGVPILHIAAYFGIGLSLAMGALWVYRTRSRYRLVAIQS